MKSFLFGVVFIWAAFLFNSCTKEKAIPLSVGKSYQGGVIFYLDSTGNHGLICAPADQSTSAQWWNGSYIITGATAQGLDSGRYNTNKIISTQGRGNYAAFICTGYNGGGYTDWYLPSLNELDLLYHTFAPQGTAGITTGRLYWSSTEYASGFADYGGYNDGYFPEQNKELTGHVRAIRSF